MRRLIPCTILSALIGIIGAATSYAGNSTLKDSQIVINIDKQKLQVVHSGTTVETFPISTSKFGLGDDLHSYKTPLGTLEVCGKVGDDLPVGAVIKKGRFTGEVLPPNAPGRDPIVTRVIHLQGTETQNRHALGRGIYIHGTPEERRIGKPVSWGCIRMRSKDVVELYNQVQIGTKVIICSKSPGKKTPGWGLSSFFFAWWS